jgi:hypothetical protein
VLEDVRVLENLSVPSSTLCRRTFMEKKSGRKSTKKSAAPKKRCCMCPTTAARDAIRAAKVAAQRSGSCAPLHRAYEDFKRAAGEEYPLLPPGQRGLLAREALKKQNEVRSFCARIEDRDAARFNGLLGLGLFGIL